MKDFDTTLYFITDSTPYTEEEFLHRVEEGLKGGATIIQLREKNRSTREYIDLAEKVHEISQRYKVPLIIDDRLDVALACKAEGVHLGQSDMQIDIARKIAQKIAGKDFIIGATTKTVEQAKKAYELGADYCGVGAIYPTTTKVKTVLTSTQTLSEICEAVPIPVNAIGGLNKTNTEVLRGIKIAGICVVSAIMHAKNPREEAEILLSIAKKLTGR